MKILSRIGFLFLVCFSLCSSLTAETKTVNAEVRSVTGVATFTPPGGEPTDIKPGTVIPPGSVINTAPGAQVNLFLGRNAGVVRLSENSVLKIQTLQQTGTGSETVTDTQLELQKGEVFGHVNKQSAASTYQITLPDGVVDLKQSRFQVTSKTLDNLADNNNAPNAPQTPTGSTVRLISGEGHFTHEGTTVEFKGPGEFTPGAGGVVPLNGEAVKVLAKEFQGLDTKKFDTTQTQTQAPQQVAQNQVQPQDAPLSPTVGSTN